MPDPNAAAIAVMDAFITAANCRLEQVPELSHPLQARHTVYFLSRLTGRLLGLADRHPGLAPVRPRLNALVAAGQQVSAAVPYQCRECGELYRHAPPGTTKTLCEYCLPESMVATAQNSGSR